MANPAIRSITAFVLLLGSALSFAANITVGEKLPALKIDDKGECVLKGSQTEFVPWNSGSLGGKVEVVEYVAARAGIDDIHKPFFDVFKKEAFPAAQVGVIKLVNSDDAMWGTSGLVAGEIRKNKKQEPDTRLVVDADGLGLKLWKLHEKQASLAILDQQGNVLFFKEGPLTDAEISTNIALIKQQLIKQQLSSKANP